MTLPKSSVPLHLRHLHAEGLLSDAQVAWLAERWPDVPDAWLHHPLFGEVREHTRFYLERSLDEREEGSE